MEEMDEGLLEMMGSFRKKLKLDFYKSMVSKALEFPIFLLVPFSGEPCWSKPSPPLLGLGILTSPTSENAAGCWVFCFQSMDFSLRNHIRRLSGT